MTPEINGHTVADLLSLDVILDPPAGTPRKGRRVAAPVAAAPEPVSVPTPAPLPEPVLTVGDAALSSDAPTLADDVADLTMRLARSFNIAPCPGGPKPAQFVEAVKAIHDRLRDSRRQLSDWQGELDQREMALNAREQAVERREQEAAASLALAELCPSPARATQRRGILARWRG